MYFYHQSMKTFNTETELQYELEVDCDNIDSIKEFYKTIDNEIWIYEEDKEYSEKKIKKLKKKES